jgi:hypothetical protein
MNEEDKEHLYYHHNLYLQLVNEKEERHHLIVGCVYCQVDVVKMKMTKLGRVSEESLLMIAVIFGDEGNQLTQLREV